MMTIDDVRLGRRKAFLLRILDPIGDYPALPFIAANAMFVPSESLVYSVVEAEPPNEFGYSDIAWNSVNEIRLWGAHALSTREGKGFYFFIPEYRLRLHHCTLCLATLRREVVDRAAARIAAALPLGKAYELHRVAHAERDVRALYEALTQANAVVLRGVNCFLKALLLWRIPGCDLLTEEMGLNLYIALEAGLSTIRKRLTVAAGRSVSFADVFDFVAANFTAGDALAEYWQDAHDQRNALLHPDSDLSPYVIQPMTVDDIWELLDPMLSLYRYILINESRPPLAALLR